LLAQLAAVGGALAGSPGPTVQTLAWRDRALDLQMTASSTDAFARFAQAIAARGLAADVASTQPTDQGVQARVRIHAGAT
jgi:hypothetical protein